MLRNKFWKEGRESMTDTIDDLDLDLDETEIEDEIWEDPSDIWQSFLEPTKRMSRDLRRAAATLGPREVRHLVDSYYTMQEGRKRAGGQVKALNKSGEPHDIINWLFAQSDVLEKQIKITLDIYTENHVMGSWMRDVYGIGPVLSAGLLAHIYMGEWCLICKGHGLDDCKDRQKDKKLKLSRHKYQPEESCPTAGRLWAFAGWAGDGQKKWEKGQKRPYNAKFRTLCWKVGQSFMKFSNKDECFYGQWYRTQKDKYIGLNDLGTYADHALERSTTVKKTTDAWAWYNACYPTGTSRAYEEAGKGLKADAKAEAKKELLAKLRLPPGRGIGMLPPGHIDARARRWAVKLFIAHLHNEWYFRHFGKPAPLPYAIAHLGHAHIIKSPI